MNGFFSRLTTASLFVALFSSLAVVAVADPNKRKFDENKYFNERTYLDNPGFSQPEDYTFIFNKGVRLFNKGKYGLAEIHFRRASKGSRLHCQANAYLGITNIKQNDHRSAVRYLKRALKGNPDMYQLKATLGLSYVELGKMDKASEVLTQLRESKNRIIEQGADEDDFQKSISVLEQALIDA